MMRDIADITCLDVDPHGDNQRTDKRTNFEFTAGHQTVKNEITGYRSVEFAVFLIQGTVITHYNREAASRIQTGQRFQDALEQIMYLSEQKAKHFGQYVTASEKFDDFKRIGQTNIEDQVNIMNKTNVINSFRKTESRRNLTRKNHKQSKLSDRTFILNNFQTKMRTTKGSTRKKSAKSTKMEESCQFSTVNILNPKLPKFYLYIENH